MHRATRRRRTPSAASRRGSRRAAPCADVSREGDNLSSVLYGSSVTRCPDWRASYPPPPPRPRPEGRPSHSSPPPSPPPPPPPPSVDIRTERAPATGRK